jgi:hypothetical protein
MGKTSVNAADIVDSLHKVYPSVGKSIIENELRKTGGDIAKATLSVQNLNETILATDQILGEEQKHYDYQSDSDEDMVDEEADLKHQAHASKKDKSDIYLTSKVKGSDSDDSSEYESQDEKEAEEIDEICKTQVNNYMEEQKTPTGFEDEQSEEFFKLLSKDLTEQFPGVPPQCIQECVKYFYPNMGKIEHVLGEFQKHWINYNQDYDGYKKGRKDRKKHHKREKHGRKEKKEEIDFKLNPKIAEMVIVLQQQLDEGKDNLSTEELKELRNKLKGLKRLQRQERRESKKVHKDERRAIRAEAKKIKALEREKRKAEKAAKKVERGEAREAKKVARSEKDYEDDKFFKEIREEPDIIKQYLKEAKKNLRKAEKSGNEEEIVFYTSKIEEYKKSFEEGQDKVIMLTYERYNKPEEASRRLDLHGLKKKEALRLLEKILAIRIQQINEKLGDKESREPFEFNIVTGRGNHSGRAVLKPAVKNYLLEHGYKYAEFSNGAGYVAYL